MNNFVLNDFLEEKEFLSFDKNWNLTKYVSSIVDTAEGREIIIHILDIWDYVNEESKNIWLDLIERAGFYPYYTNKVLDLDTSTGIQAQIRTEFFKSDNLDIYFNEQQKEIEQQISSGRNIVVSAPTSFGKSLFIEEIVAKNSFKNILIIQPTLALIDETRKKLKKYTMGECSYNIVINTRQESKEKNIFILTAERVLEYPSLPKIDFFIVDEFYKVSSRRHDSRIDALNVALYKIMKHEPQALFLTPSVDSLSQKFQEKYNIHFFQTDFAMVNTKTIKIAQSGKKKRLFKLLSELKEPSIIYVKSPNEAYSLANEYLDYLRDDSHIVNSDLDIFEWMDKNISPRWQLKRLLEHGVGAHNGALPRHIVTSEIDLFNSGRLNILFATVSLIEGVNTAAKNIIIYSQNKGGQRIDFFDFANIRGRAGRMGRYFTGNVYLFIDEPPKEEFKIDVPVADQEQVSDEVMINTDSNDVIDKERLNNLKKDIPRELEEIIKKNLIAVNGQKKLYFFLKENYSRIRNYMFWNSTPTYDQLWNTLYIGYKFLKDVDQEGLAKNKAVTSLKLINEPLSQIIKEQEMYYKKQHKKDSLNRAINYVLNFQRTFASFEIPKILAVVDSIQKYVCEEQEEIAGDYTYFASTLENEKTDERLRYLIDFGVPSSAIKKIQLPADIEDVENFVVKNLSYIKNSILSYESYLLEQAIGRLND